VLIFSFTTEYYTNKPKLAASDDCALKQNFHKKN
jgi:hypothetical protein